jgi:hypothetical protein
MRIPRFYNLLLFVLPVLLASTCFGARKDNGSSNYGDSMGACPLGSGTNASTFGSFTATCFSGNGSNSALFEISDSTAPVPSAFSVVLDGNTPDYGLLVCDSGVGINCTDTSNNPVTFSGNPVFGATTTTFTFSNFTGDVVFYTDDSAFIADITPIAGSSSAPEPKDTVALGLLMLGSFGFIRQFVARRKNRATL